MSEHEFDMNAYRGRTGLRAGGPPSLPLLRSVIACHTATIPFENLDIVLGRPIRLDIQSVQAKLVTANRGGYCFEQNTLLRAALEHLGFSVTSLMGRVVRGFAVDAITPRTHMLLRVDLPEGPLLADAGFGNLTPTAPLRLDRDDPQPTEHEDYKLQPMGSEALLQVRLGSDWLGVYRFSSEPSHPIDHEVANWFTSTLPERLFTANVIAARAGPNCRRTLFNGAMTIRGSETWSTRMTMKTEAMLQAALREHFGIDLDADELATVYAAMSRYRDHPDTAFRLD